MADDGKVCILKFISAAECHVSENIYSKTLLLSYPFEPVWSMQSIISMGWKSSILSILFLQQTLLPIPVLFHLLL